MLRVTEATVLLLAPLNEVRHDSVGNVLDSCVRVHAEVGVVKIQYDTLHIVGECVFEGILAFRKGTSLLQCCGPKEPRS